MRYAIITYGTRGDVQPFIALALGLMQKGEAVILLAPENFKDFVQGYGVDFYPLHGDIEGMLHSAEPLSLLKKGSAVALLKYMQKVSHEIQPRLNQDLLNGCREADFLITGVLTAHWINAIAEKNRKKFAIIQLNPPSTATRVFPFAGLDFFNFPQYNLLSHWLVKYFYWQLNKRDINHFRNTLGLESQKQAKSVEIEENVLTIYAYSPQLIPRPQDWGNNTIVSGFLTLNAKSRETNKMDSIPEALIEWLKAGEQPIYIGFGSVPIPDPEYFSRIIKKLIANTNLRVLLGTGWSLIPDLPDSPQLFITKYVNHDWLLPQCKTAIIHGGIGTVAAVLHSKISAIVVSIIADQPWWGKIIERKKLGVHIPFKKLSYDRLIRAIALTETTELIVNAKAVGELIRNEDGLNLTIDKLHTYFLKKSI